MAETKEPELKEEAPSPPSSKASSDSSAVTDGDVATWKASFANSNPAREKGALDKPDFVALVLKVFEDAETGLDFQEKPSLEDLDAAFTLADEDKSGKVDQPEFVQLMRLVKGGKVTGLSRPGFFQRGAVEQKFKGELATVAASDAKAVAEQEAKTAAELAEKSKKAAAKLADAKAKAGAPPAKSQDEADELEWRALFTREAGAKKTLDKAQFVQVVRKLIVRMMMTTKSGGSVPEAKDLDAAFEVADEDKSEGVDEEEFITMMKVIKAGGAEGLSSSGMLFFASNDKAAKFKAALKKADEAGAAKKDKEMKEAFEKAAAGDEVAKAEAEAMALALSAKDAAQRTKAAAKDAAKAAAKAAYLNGETTSPTRSGSVDEKGSSKGSGEETPEEKQRAEAAEAAKLSSLASTLSPAELRLKHGYDSVSDMMLENGIGQFTLKLHGHGVDTFDELKGCTDRWLMTNLNMKKAHLLKFRRALRDAKAEGSWVDPTTGEALSVFEAEDGFRGTYWEVMVHEAKLVRLKIKQEEEEENALRRSQASLAGEKDGPEELPPNQRQDFAIYEVEEDGFRGSLDECLAHEDLLAKLKNPHLRASRKGEAPPPLDPAEEERGAGGKEDKEEKRDGSLTSAADGVERASGGGVGSSAADSQRWKAPEKSAASLLRENFFVRARRDAAEFGETTGETLGKKAFVSYLKYLNTVDATSKAHYHRPSDADLEACFELADDDHSGDINVEEFVKIARFVKQGKAKGLSKPLPSKAKAPVKPLADQVVLGSAQIFAQFSAAAEAATRESGTSAGGSSKNAEKAASLDPAAFAVLLNSLLEQGTSNKESDARIKPSMQDLEAAFYLADLNQSGNVGVVEFFRVWALVQQGRVKGLSAKSLFRRKNNGTLVSVQPSKAEAFQAGLQGEAALRAHYQAALIESIAGNNSSTDDSKEGMVVKPGLEKADFVALVHKLLLPLARAQGKPPATLKDLEACFEVADEDKSGYVNEDEFVIIMKLVEAGKIKGLGQGSVVARNGTLSVRALGVQEGLAEACVFAVGDTVKFKESYAMDMPTLETGTLGLVLAAHEDGDVDVLFHGAKSALAVITRGEEQFALVSRCALSAASAAAFAPVNPALDHVLVRIYEAEDGFRGTYDEVLDYEEKLANEGAGKSAETNFHLYEAPDGFRGTYDEVVAHEAKLGYKYCEETGAVKPHNDEVGSVASVLHAEGVDLGDFVEPFHQHGVDFATELSGCSDAWLAKHVGLTAPGQLAKFREVVPDHAADLAATATDGFKGTASDVTVHEVKLAELAEERMESAGAAAAAAAAGAASTVVAAPPPAIEEHHERVLLRIYEAEDGFRGTYEEVVAHEEKLQLSQGKEHEVSSESNEQRDKVLMRIYEAEDGFRGTYDEVVEHEVKTGLAKGSEQEVNSETVLFRIYEAPDGFRGTYDEVKEYEQAHNFKSEEIEDPVSNPRIYSIYRCDDGFRGTYEECVAHENEPDYVGSPSTESSSSLAPTLEPHHESVLFRVYEAEDGFRGSYDEVVAHEAGLSGSVAWHEPTAVKGHLDSLQSEMTKQQEEIEKLKALVAQY